MAESLPRVGSALIVRDEANRILLGKRNKDPQRGSWILPGGKIHAFESIAAAAARELKEETGLDIEVENHFRVYEVINPPDEHRIVIYSWGRVVGGTPKASDDLADLRFASLDELGELPTTPLVRRVLEDAGFLLRQRELIAQPITQLGLCSFPIPVAGARQVRRPSRRHVRRRSSREPVQTSRLLFDRTLLR